MFGLPINLNGIQYIQIQPAQIRHTSTHSLERLAKPVVCRHITISHTSCASHDRREAMERRYVWGAPGHPCQGMGVGLAAASMPSRQQVIVPCGVRIFVKYPDSCRPCPLCFDGQGVIMDWYFVDSQRSSPDSAGHTRIPHLTH